MPNILVGQSGGPTAVINASLYGIIKRSEETGNTIYGMINGIEGFLSDKIINLSDYSRKTDIELLKVTPASFLGSCRYKLPEDLNNEVYDKIFKKFNKLDINSVLYIGGNDSMDTVDKLSKYAKKVSSNVNFIGVPKTIDNDLVMTDHTPGFGSTAKYVAATVKNIVWDAGVYSHPVVTIVELMGRHAGWVTASSVLARTQFDRNPMLIYLPETDFDTQVFLGDVNNALNVNNSVVVCVSEGIKDANGKFICEYKTESGTDQFGHKMLTGCGKVLEQLVKNHIGCKCRSIEINLPQRCSAAMTSATDTDEAEQAGSFAVSCILDGHTGKMVSFNRSNNPYKISYGLIEASAVCNKEKRVPSEWIVNGNDISSEFNDYVYPLIQGQNNMEFKNGLPKLLKPAYLVDPDLCNHFHDGN